MDYSETMEESDSEELSYGTESTASTMTMSSQIPHGGNGSSSSLGPHEGESVEQHHHHKEGFFKLARKKRKQVLKSDGPTEEKLKEAAKLLKASEVRLRHLEEALKERDKKIARLEAAIKKSSSSGEHHHHSGKGKRSSVLLNISGSFDSGFFEEKSSSSSHQPKSKGKHSKESEVVAHLEEQLAASNTKVKEISERSDERVQQLSHLLKESETKLSKATDITKRALERLAATDREKRMMEKNAKSVARKLKLLDENFSALEGAVKSLKEISKKNHETLMNYKKQLAELSPTKEESSENDEEEEEEEEEEEGGELWDFILDTLVQTKGDSGNEDESSTVPSHLDSLAQEAVEAGLVKENFVDAFKLVAMSALKKELSANTIATPSTTQSTSMKKEPSATTLPTSISTSTASIPTTVSTSTASIPTTIPTSTSSTSIASFKSPSQSALNASPVASSSSASSVHGSPLLGQPGSTTSLEELRKRGSVILGVEAIDEFVIPRSPEHSEKSSPVSMPIISITPRLSPREKETEPTPTPETPKTPKLEPKPFTGSKHSRVTLKVVVFEARGLKWAEVDPYCCVTIAGLRKQTNVLSQCKDDVWNETFVFDLSQKNDPTLIIDCLNNPNKPGDSFLGRVTIDIGELAIDSPLDSWFSMSKKSNNDPEIRGDLLISVEKTVAESSPAPTRATVGKKRIERQTSLSGMIKMMVNHTAKEDVVDNPSNPLQNSGVFSAPSDVNPLIAAASASRMDLDQVAFLLEKGMRVPAGWCNENKHTLVHLMVLKGTAKHLAIALGLNADLQQQDHLGFTALHIASIKAPVECIKMLLNAGLDVNVEDAFHKLTPLHHAALGGNAPAMKLLLARGATVDHQDRNQATALLKAAYGGHIKCLKVLLKAGAKINAADNEGNTAFLVACLEGRFEAALYLKKKGANTNVNNVMGDTPLWCAVKHNSPHMIKILLKETDINQTMGKFKLGILHRCMLQLEEPLCEKVIPLLLKKNLKVDGQNAEGKTPLFYAAFYKKIELMKLLIKHGANVRVRDQAGNTVLHFASTPEAVQLLVDAMPKEIVTKEVNTQNNQGNSPLHAAYVFYGDAVVQKLKQLNADEEAKNLNGNTPSQVAWAVVKKVLMPFFPEDEAMPNCGGLYISKVN